MVTHHLQIRVDSRCRSRPGASTRAADLMPGRIRRERHRPRRQCRGSAMAWKTGTSPRKRARASTRSTGAWPFSATRYPSPYASQIRGSGAGRCRKGRRRARRRGGGASRRRLPARGRQAEQHRIYRRRVAEAPGLRSGPRGGLRLRGRHAPLRVSRDPRGPAGEGDHVWSLCVVLHKMVSGEHPFAGGSADEVARRIRGRRVIPFHGDRSVFAAQTS